MKSKGKAGEAPANFLNAWGIPKFLHIDQAKEEWDGEWGRVQKTFIIPQKTTEPYSPWYNACENPIGQHNKWVWHIKQSFCVPEQLWDWLSRYVAGLQCAVMGDNDVKSGTEELLHKILDISDYIDFHFYETVKYYSTGSYPNNMEHFGK